MNLCLTHKTSFSRCLKVVIGSFVWIIKCEPLDVWRELHNFLNHLLGVSIKLQEIVRTSRNILKFVFGTETRVKAVKLKVFGAFFCTWLPCFLSRIIEHEGFQLWNDAWSFIIVEMKPVSLSLWLLSDLEGMKLMRLDMGWAGCSVNDRLMKRKGHSGLFSF